MHPQLDTAVTITNNASSYLPKPEMIVVIKNAYGVSNSEIEELEEVLKPISQPSQSSLLPPLYSSFRPNVIPASRLPRRAVWQNIPRGVEIRLSPDSFRPQTAWRTEDLDVVVISRDPEAYELAVDWRLTVEGVGEAYDGTTTLAVDKSLGAWELIRREIDYHNQQ